MTLTSHSSKQRLQITIHGAVQGIGFRPFVYRLATELQLTGFVNNSAAGVLIEVEGNRETLETFFQRIDQDKPDRSYFTSLESIWLTPVNYKNFEIRPSITGAKTAIVLPDIATCSHCLQEIFDPNNRRYHYPFTNCTNCGPRYSIIENLPYDRPQTTMRSFIMCSDCQTEYDHPLDRRFHAQPNACPNCGPQLTLWDRNGNILSDNFTAILDTAKAISKGKIVAIKGMGGFQLLAHARKSKVIQELRIRKKRSAKPFALMYPHLELVKKHCLVSPIEERLLLSPAAPIVILRSHVSQRNLFSDVAPDNPYLGVMLPYTPLHHLLMFELGFPVVATSGNLSDEPICIDNQEALIRLSEIADLFLVHNRPIVRAIDDAIVREVWGREMIIRRARGYAPLPLIIDQINEPKKLPILAVGGHLKNTIAIGLYPQIFLSQHIGDLATKVAFEAFENTINSLENLYDFTPEIIACDAHPDYLSTQFAHQLKLPVVAVQHHYAHVLACLTENQLKAPVLGIAWDGTGYGLDQTIWGGEFLYITDTNFQRIGHFKTFPLPGGDQAVKEPRRSALGLLYSVFGDEVFKMSHLAPIASFSGPELSIIKTMLKNQINTPITSSVGRLFDAISSLLSLQQIVSFEGQAAMALEFLATNYPSSDYYDLPIVKSDQDNMLIVNWQPLIYQILADLPLVDQALIAAKFHHSLVRLIANFTNILATSSSPLAEKINPSNLPIINPSNLPIVLTGGCFQNQYLLTKTIEYLQAQNMLCYWHQRLPSNDGAIALGQIVAAWRQT